LYVSKSVKSIVDISLFDQNVLVIGLKTMYMIISKIAESSVFIFSKLFDWHSSGENVSMKESKQCVIIYSVG